MARKKSSGSAVLWLILLAVALIAIIPKEIWIVLGAVGLLGSLLYLAMNHSGAKATGHSVSNNGNPITDTTERVSIPDTVQAKRSEPSGHGIGSNKAQPTGFRIPAPPESVKPPRWYRAGEEVEVAGRKISGGLLYVGFQVESYSGESDPSLINLSKSVDRVGDFTKRLTDYWPKYSSISSEARAAFLSWLSDGRRHPEADIGYVFIFFYGLERRVVVDAKNDETVRTEFPAIRRELEELLAVYGPRSGSFMQYAKGLLGLVTAWVGSEKLYLKPFPEMQRGYEIPIPIRIALGQASVDRYPVPFHLALSWIKNSPERYLRTPATRCVTEFDKLFEIEYARKFGAGLLLPQNKTKLKLGYRPASSALADIREVILTFGDLPDVTVLTKPINDLWQLAEEVTAQLESYSRYLGRNPDAQGSPEAYLLLPIVLWPSSSQDALNYLKTKVGDGFFLSSLSELLPAFGANSMLARDRFAAFCGALRSVDLLIEPDVSMGAKTPKFEDKIVLFPPAVGDAFQETSAYKSALLTLQLASVIAIADGSFCTAEFAHLQEQIENWNHLTNSQLQRLRAHVHLLQQSSMSLASLKKQLEALNEPAKEAIAGFMTAVAQADGTVSVAEVKILEKIYAALGIEPKRVFSDIHAMASGVTDVAKPKSKATGFSLDKTKIQELQKDTEKVSALLSKIFTVEEVAAVPTVVEPIEEVQPPESRFLNLDESHASFARHLLTRKEWARTELQDTASDLELMLDGALEQINDASWDTYDLAFTEGDDPISVNPEVLEKIAA
ncbi:MAG: hypothetical protein RL173_383 [Fibrobacterota bacterium]|jgi:uncharacterized tellurite resistance protein B-like protein